MTIHEVLLESGHSAVVIDGHENAIIGISYSPVTQVVYSKEKIIDNLIEGGMNNVDANEYFSYNIEGSLHQDGPIVMTVPFNLTIE